MGPQLLAIVEAGGYPDLSFLYAKCGFSPTVAYSSRKAFALCRKINPKVVVAEFKYGPVYGARLSNMESLIAVLQTNCPTTKLIVLCDVEDKKHAQQLTKNFPLLGLLTFPLDQSLLEKILRAIRE